MAGNDVFFSGLVRLPEISTFPFPIPPTLNYRPYIESITNLNLLKEEVSNACGRMNHLAFNKDSVVFKLSPVVFSGKEVFSTKSTIIYFS
jgi:hypothetical protein